MPCWSEVGEGVDGVGGAGDGGEVGSGWSGTLVETPTPADSASNARFTGGGGQEGASASPKLAYSPLTSSSRHFA